MIIPIPRISLRRIAALVLGAGLAAAAPTAAQVSRPCCAEPPSGMVGWWPFDEAAGPTAADIAGAPQNATHVVNPAPLPAGKVRGALEFNGSSYVQAASAPDLQFGRGDFSFDAWLRLRDGSGVTSVLDKRTLSGGQVRGYHVFVANGRLGLQLADGLFTNYVASSVLPVGQWVHVTITVDRDSPTGVRFYYNGAAAGTGDPTLRSGSLASPAPLRIGGHSTSPQGGLRGALDEVELFDRVLWPSEIVTLVRADSVGKCRQRCGPLDVRVWSTPQEWRVTSRPSGAGLVPVNSNPVLVAQPNGAWQTSQTGPWVSAATTPDGSGPSGWYEYEYTFCLCPGFSDPRLRVAFRVDNSYQLWLNTTQQLPPVNAVFSAPSPGQVVMTSGSGFVPGVNRLRVRVYNEGGPTGFALDGSLTAVGGRCPQS